MRIQGLRELLTYQTYLIDLWGVLHNGKQVFPQAIQALIDLKQHQKRVILLSNSPRRAHAAESRLTEMGIGRHLYDKIYTSGEDCFDSLVSPDQKIYKGLGSYFHIGPWGKESMACDLPQKKTTTVDQADFILVTGLNKGEISLDSYISLLNQAYHKGIPLICANPDLTVMLGGNPMICAGVIARYYEKMGGKTYYHGKPYSGIYQKLLKGIPLSQQPILAIGDSLGTDIKGASYHHLETLLVLSGIHHELKTQSTDSILAHGEGLFHVRPTYISDMLQF